MTAKNSLGEFFRIPVRLFAALLLLLGVLVVQSGTAGALAGQRSEPSLSNAPLAPLAGISAPSASWTQNGGRIDVFEIGSDGRLLQKYWTSGSGWQGWFAFAPPAAGIGSAPSATWTTDGGRIDVFVTGASDGRLYQKYWTSSAGWSNWVDLGGTLISQPSASWTQNGGRIDVFGIGTDGRLYQKYWTSSSGWQGWFGFAAPAAGIGSAPTATWTTGGGRIDVFVTGKNDGRLYQKYWTSSGGWSNWVDLGGTLISAPSASWTQNGGRIDVFGIGTDGRLYQKYWTSGSGWQGWFGFAAPAAGISFGPSATWTSGGGRIDVFVTGASNGRLYQKYWTSSAGWSNWVDLG